jgi:hypothetical protein
MYEPMVVKRLAGMLGELARVPSARGDDATRIDVIAALERLKAAVYAAGSTAHSPSYWSTATASAATPTAMPRSGTSITSNPTQPVDRRLRATDVDCVNAAIT